MKVLKNWIRGGLNAKSLCLFIDQTLDRFGQISGRRRLSSLRQIVSPDNMTPDMIRWLCFLDMPCWLKVIFKELESNQISAQLK